MSLRKEQKQKIIEDLLEKIDRQKVMIFTGVSGLKVRELFDLRRKLREVESQLKVAKKTLMKIVFQKKKVNIDPRNIEGELAIIFGFQEEIAPTKIAYEFSKKHENLKILGGILGGEFIEKERIIEIAQLPTREELLARLIGSISAPVSGLINVLQGNMRDLVYVLSVIKNNR